MKAKMILMLSATPLVLGMAMWVAAAASGGYVPTPAPVPMQTFNKYIGDVVHGFFTIEDASGPEGLRLVIEPNELTITSSIIEPIAGYANARRYIYYFDHTVTGSKTIIVKSYDSRNREVINSIVINLLDDDLHVFTNCAEVTEPNEPVSYFPPNSYELMQRAEAYMRYRSLNNLEWERDRVISGKQELSRKYDNIQEMDILIAKYKDPSYAVSYGRIVEN